MGSLTLFRDVGIVRAKVLGDDARLTAAPIRTSDAAPGRLFTHEILTRIVSVRNGCRRLVVSVDSHAQPPMAPTPQYRRRASGATSRRYLLGPLGAGRARAPPDASEDVIVASQRVPAAPLCCRCLPDRMPIVSPYCVFASLHEKGFSSFESCILGPRARRPASRNVCWAYPLCAPAARREVLAEMIPDRSETWTCSI